MSSYAKIVINCTQFIDHMINNPVFNDLKTVDDFDEHIIQHYNNITDEYKPPLSEFVEEIKSNFEINPAPPVIREYDIGGWLDSSLRLNNQYHWDFYKKHLRNNNKSGMIPYLESDTYSILDSCMNPMEIGIWDRRGLVYGNVQSGKTSNYVGLINRAFDTGYQIAIVLTGMTEDLRKQTQDRINEGVIGRDENNNPYGVGNIKGFQFKVSKGTTMFDDFSTKNLPTQIANLRFSHKIVFVVKKNVTILNNLIYWLKKKSDEQNKNVYKIQKTPFLIIDDEADNASIQSITKNEKESGDYDLKSINRNIRLVLSLIEMKSFVAYTATPYSVVMQRSEDDERSYTIDGIEYNVDENSDLFPRDFIIPIRHGDQYLSIERVFGTENEPGLPVITQIDSERRFAESIDDLQDTFSTGNNEYDFNEIPGSLKEAIHHYIISSIIRDFRGQEDHNTMLIHTSHKVSKIDYLAWKVSEYLIELFDLVLNNNKFVMVDFEEVLERIVQNSKNPLFSEYFTPKTPYSTPNRISKEKILNKIEQLTVVSLHSKKNDPNLRHKNHILNYKSSKSQNYIVVGGNRLSRGLTIEGLHTSYFIRHSSRKDSLYQMGRWFGYRLGFEDCVRIYTSSDLYMWYRQIMILESRLRRNIDEMNSQDHMTPSNWEIAVSRSTEMDSLNRRLEISDPGKLRHTASRRMSFGGMSIRTKYFSKDVLLQNENTSIAENFLLDLISEGHEVIKNVYPKNDPNINLKDVSLSKIIQFLEIFSFHKKQERDFEDLIQYLKDKQGDIKSFSVVLKRLKRHSSKIKHENGAINFSDVKRRNVAPEEAEYYEIDALLDGDNENTFDIITKENLQSYEQSQDPAKFREELRKAIKTGLLILYSVDATKSSEIDRFISLYAYTPKTGVESSVLVRE